MELRRTTLALLPVAVLVAGCGGGGGGSERARKVSAICGLAPLAAAPKLPADFPTPAGVTYRQEAEAGPSQVVDGTFAAGIDEAYAEYERAVEDAGYKILFKEREEDDAEISYEGPETTGQIALRAECGEEEKILVHITSRPKD